MESVHFLKILLKFSLLLGSFGPVRDHEGQPLENQTAQPEGLPYVQSATTLQVNEVQ